jgi:rod shape-determining protein MreC
MNRKLIFVVLLFLSSLFFFEKEEKFQETFSLVTLPIKGWYSNIINQIDGTWEKYTKQADSIEKLREENILLRKYLYNQKMTINRLEQYTNSKVEKYDIDKNILHIQTLSYKKMNDFSYIYLTDNGNLEEDEIYGLIQKNVAAGIAIKKNNRLEGILLSNENCQFSTFIGDKNIPGIAKGIDEKSMEINFIPKWSKIAIGDKVVTSGLDNIFLANIPVGTVSKILTRSTYKTAIIETYADILRPDYFYLVKEVPMGIQPIDKNILENTEDNGTIDKIDTSH